MKKLMIAAAIVCAAVASQAASFKWSDAGIVGKDGTGTYAGGGTVLIYVCEKNNIENVIERVSGAEYKNGSMEFIGTLTKAAVGTTYTYYYTIEDGDQIYTSTTKNKKVTDPSTASVDFMASGSWSSVPEPTSGLLLLLGVAGLALRRRRA